MNYLWRHYWCTFINILIVAIWKSRQAYRPYGWGNMPLQAVKLPMSHNNVVGENTVLQLNILETGVLTLVVQNSSPTRLRLVGDELWTTRVRTPVSKMFRWRTYNYFGMLSKWSNNLHIDGCLTKERLTTAQTDPSTTLIKLNDISIDYRWW